MKAYLAPPRAAGGVQSYISNLYKYLGKWVQFVDNPSKADVVHIQTPHIQLKGEVFTAHGCLAKGNEAFIGPILQQASKVKIVICPSYWQEKRIKELGCKTVTKVIQHGLDLGLWDSIRSYTGDYLLWSKLFLERHVHNDFLVDLAYRRPDLKFIVTMAEKKPPSNMQIIGIQPFPKMQQYIANCGIYLRTNYESFGIQTLEALACGKPIVALADSSSEEIVIHKKNGFLYRTVEELEDGIDYCYRHYTEMSKWARASILNFSWEQAAALTYDVYREVLSV